MSISLEWVRVNELVPHEDILLNVVRQSALTIKRTKKILPIIVDTDTNLILDGHHRFYSMKILEMKRIPVYYVKYSSDDIKVNSWYRQITPHFNVNLSDGKGDFCVSYYGGNILCDSSLYKLYWREHLLEQELIKTGFAVVKNPNQGLFIPPLSKEYIISIAMKGLRFPPKSTRHEYKFYIPKEELFLNEY